VIKAVSGRFHPVHQWFLFDAIECLPATPLPDAEFLPLGSRCVPALSRLPYRDD
jgi:ubiquitin-activating enzyme E1